MIELAMRNLAVVAERMRRSALLLLLATLAIALPTEAETFTLTEAPLDINNLNSFALYGNDLYYGLRVEGERSVKLVRIDGLTGALQTVIEIPDDRVPLLIREVLVAGDAIYFVSAPSLSYFGTLWKYLPETDTTVRLKDFDNLAPRELASAGNTVFLAAWATNITRSALWRTDGTPEGTVEVATGIVAENLTTLEPFVYFTSLGRDFYRVGEIGGTRNIITNGNFRDAVNRRVVKLLSYNFRIYFLASETASQTLELWSTDGSVRGTRRETFIRPESLPRSISDKDITPFQGNVASGSEPPYLGLVDGEIVFSYQKNPFWYFYRYKPGTPDGTNAELIADQLISFILPFNGRLILAGPGLPGRRDVFLYSGGTFLNLNQSNTFGNYPGPLLSTPTSAYFVDTTAALSEEPPETFDFPLLRLDGGKLAPQRVPMGDELAGLLIGGVAAANEERAFLGLVDLTGQKPARILIMDYAEPQSEGEGEGADEGEGAVEGEGEGSIEGEPTGNLEELAQSIFDDRDNIDTDGDGSFSLAELDAASIEITTAQFAALDTNDDGKLSTQELLDAGAIAPPMGCACPSADSLRGGIKAIFGDLITLSTAALMLLAMGIFSRRPGL